MNIIILNYYSQTTTNKFRTILVNVDKIETVEHDYAAGIRAEVTLDSGRKLRTSETVEHIHMMMLKGTHERT